MGRQDTKKLILTNYPTFYLNEEEIIDPFSVFKDFFSFAAVRKSKIGNVVEDVKDEKIKGRKIKIQIAKS